MKKTLANQFYNGAEQITISAQEYILLKTAVEQGLNALASISFPEVKAFVNAETGEYINKPNQKQIKDGFAIETVSPEKTFSLENRVISYDGKVTQEMLAARELVMIIHQRNIEQGLTTDVEELQRQFEASQVEVV
jgi:translation elongation factor EF-Tu-like GTPase